MTTTVSKIRGLKATSVVVDEWTKAVNYAWSQAPRWLPEHYRSVSYAPYHCYEMVKIGHKEYGFRMRLGGPIVHAYKCSHLEAQRRFKLKLVTARLTN